MMLAVQGKFCATLLTIKDAKQPHNLLGLRLRFELRHTTQMSVPVPNCSIASFLGPEGTQVRSGAGQLLCCPLEARIYLSMVEVLHVGALATEQRVSIRYLAIWPASTSQLLWGNRFYPNQLVCAACTQT